jgi:hypothetical protein
MGTGKPSNNADVTLTAINGGLSLTGGGLQLTSGGAQVVTGNYAAPTGSNEGVGFKVNDSGNLEAYGTSQALMGRIVTRNASYMVCIGCYANVSYLTTRYAPINSTYFPTDGKVHTYVWDTTLSKWIDMYGEEFQVEGEVVDISYPITLFSETVPTDTCYWYEYKVMMMDKAWTPGAASVYSGSAWAQNDGGTLTCGYYAGGAASFNHISSQGAPEWTTSGTTAIFRLPSGDGNNVHINYRAWVKRTSISTTLGA